MLYALDDIELASSNGSGKPADKKFNITEAAHQGISINQLELEIDKCDVLCCNCHRKIHYGGIV
jgi:hypothetical protein